MEYQPEPFEAIAAVVYDSLDENKLAIVAHSLSMLNRVFQETKDPQEQLEIVKAIFDYGLAVGYLASTRDFMTPLGDTNVEA